MLDNNIKASFKKYLLAFTFLLGFFALSGYVSHSSTSGNRVSDTELFTDKSFVSKGGISYKRAALAFYTNTSSYAASKKYTGHRIIIYNDLTLIRYQYLVHLFLSTKHYFAYPIDHLYHRADQYNNTTFSQIG
ncbi:hypothetical protein SAMN05428975_1197 [Mucilaginibacter sp. OK268]|uniref:hypothetical protein n=1 Tax=Mucilaginibacter sp. OK268 TaxID=1881048 RepID=UPI00087F827F|nr:hypothetical protein [Mucilaginibacter sp. OK268]SDP33642.1 hypothetical protein SAMN05428975_1197 [Mucilaginibacter sp. OK268]